MHSFPNAQSGVQSVLYNFVEQVLLDLLRKEVIEETLDAHVTTFFDTDEAAKGLSKRLLASTFFMALIANFNRRKSNTAMQDKKCSTTIASKDL